MLNRQNGQALLIVVLVMVVALTVGLSVVSRSITSLKTSQDQASSQKALAAAESGIQQAMKRVSLNLTQLKNVNLEDASGVQYNTTISSVSGKTKFLAESGDTQNMVSKNSPVYIWTTNYSDTNPWENPWSGTLTIYWGDFNDGCGTGSKNTAIEILVISGTKDSPTLTRYAEDPCTNRNNGFDSSKVTKGQYPINNDVSLFFKTDLVIPDSDPALLVSVNPIYSDSHIAAEKTAGSLDLPDQGVNVSSVGTADKNNVTRKINAFKGLPQIPAELFPYTIFSP